MANHLGEFEQLILFALLRLGDDAYGVRIRQEIEARTGREVSSGAVYTTLGRLEGRGFVQSRTAEATAPRGGRRRKYYRLLSTGAEALQRSYADVHLMADGMLTRLTTYTSPHHPPTPSHHHHPSHLAKHLSKLSHPHTLSSQQHIQHLRTCRRYLP